MKPCLLLSLILLTLISCRKEPAAKTGTHGGSVKTQTSLQRDPTPVSLRYEISDQDMRKRTGCPTDQNSDPFAEESYLSYKYPSQQLAKAGLPMPEGTVIGRPGSHFVLLAPQSYHDQVAALLGVKGTPIQTPKTKEDASDPE